MKRQALQLYLEGLSFPSIGRVLKVSHVSVYNRINSFGDKLDHTRIDAEMEAVEIDELHSYGRNKKLSLDMCGCG